MKPVIDIVLKRHHASGEAKDDEKDRRHQAQIQMDFRKYRAGIHFANSGNNIYLPTHRQVEGLHYRGQDRGYPNNLAGWTVEWVIALRQFVHNLRRNLRRIALAFLLV